MRAMMTSAGVDENAKHKLWMDVAATATKLDNILNNKGEESPYKKFYKQDPIYEKHLQTFGELGIVTLNPGGTIKAKLEDKGIKAMFLGYAANHAGNVYRMLNLKTDQVMLTRDVKSLKSFKDKPMLPNIYQEDDGDEETLLPQAKENEHNIHQTEEEEEEEPEEDEKTIEKDVQAPTRPTCLPKLLQNLQPFNRPGSLEMEGEENHFYFFVPEEASYVNGIPITFAQA